MNELVRGPNGRWLPGNPGGGRPIGARQRLAEAIIKDICEDWNAVGADGRREGPKALAKLRVGDPGRYITAVTGLIPRDLVLTVEAEDNPLSSLSPDEKREVARRLYESIRAENPQVIDATCSRHDENSPSKTMDYETPMECVSVARKRGRAHRPRPGVARDVAGHSDCLAKFLGESLAAILLSSLPAVSEPL
jgi:hypothetical protein